MRDAKDPPAPPAPRRSVAVGSPGMAAAPRFAGLGGGGKSRGVSLGRCTGLGPAWEGSLCSAFYRLGE
jgi:hypothetical protein